MIALTTSFIAAGISAYYFLKSLWLGFRGDVEAATWHETSAVRWAILSVLLNILSKMP